MKKFLIKNKKNIGLIIVIISVGIIFLPLPANAVWYNPFTWVGELVAMSADTLLFISSVISAMFGAVFGAIIYLEAQIIDYLLSPENFPMTDAPIVTIGWGITRDLANMFFILILLIISFATVLRIKSWAIQQLWWKVVVAALLINFSLVIAGFVIDFAQVLTVFFTKQALGGGGFTTITARMMSAMQILNFYNPAPPEGIIAGATQFGASALAAFVGIILTLIGLLTVVFVFGAAAIFLVVRMIWIWFLLISAPIVWMLWILPATSGQFSKWWNDFVKWTFFAPIFAFMIFLSLSIFDSTGKLQGHIGPVALPANWTKAEAGITTAAMPAAIFQFILAIGLIFSSLIVAQKFGVYGAAASQKMLTGWGNDAKNLVGRKLRSQALSFGAKEAAPGVEARPGLLVRGAQKLAAVPGGKLLADQVFKMTSKEAGTIENAQKQFSGWTPEAIQAYLQKSPGRITSAFTQNQQLGAALALKEKGKLDKIDPDPIRAEARIKELVSMASRYSPKDVDKLLEVAPHLATEFNKKTGAIVAKIEKADKIMLQSLANSKVVLNLNPNQLRDIAQKADDAKVQKVKDVNDAEFRTLAAPIQTELDRILAITNKDRRNRELNTFLENQTAAGTPRDEVQKLEKIARSRATTKSPAWQI